MWASENGKTDIVDLLLAKGADVNIQDKYLRTALMYATKYGYIDIVERLLKVKGIGVDIQDDTEKTALMYASRNGNIDIVEILKNHVREKE